MFEERRRFHPEPDLAGYSHVRDLAPDDLLTVSIHLRADTALEDERQAVLAGQMVPLSERIEEPVSRDELFRLYAASDADQALLLQFLAQHQLQQVNTDDAYPTTIWRVSGRAADHARAFGITPAVYSHPDKGEALSHAEPVTLPVELHEPVLGVLGLDQRPTQRFAVSPPQVLPPGLLPNDVAAFYNAPISTGANQIIAMSEALGGYTLSDFQNYFSIMGEQVPVITYTGVDGTVNNPQVNDATAETYADICISGGIAPSALLEVFNGTTGSGFANTIAAAIYSSPTPNILFICEGNDENDPAVQTYKAAMDQALQASVSAGVTVLAASGDLAALLYPASSPYVLGVGGTFAAQSGNTPVAPETTWNNQTLAGATGGGYSIFFPKPAWQTGNSSGQRGVPDVSAIASSTNGWSIVAPRSNGGITSGGGGTSASCPVWAGILARIGALIGRRLGFVNATLYQNPGAFTDITTGGNGLFNAGPGWDPCTGLGTPKGAALLAVLQQGGGGGGGPQVTGLSVNTAPIGTTIAIFGQNLLPLDAVIFGNVPATTIDAISPTQVQAVVPPGSGTVDVRVQTPSGISPISSGDVFAYPGSSTGPVITSISPTSGPNTGGTFVTIYGSGFAAGTLNGVLFGTTPSPSVPILTATYIQAESPPGSGTVDIRVVMSTGESPITPADQFSYGSPPPPTGPAVTGVSPNTGPAAGGNTVTVTGSGFSTPAFGQVFFGGVPGNPLSVTDTSITVVVPAHAAGVVDVRVTNALSQISPITAADQYTYQLPPPQVTGINPPQGPVSGGNAITILGNGFTGATLVTFGGQAATANLIVINDSTILIPSVPGVAVAQGVDVQVFGPGGGSALSPADRYVYLPVVIGVNPNSGPTTGGTVVIVTVQGLPPGATFNFGGIPVSTYTQTGPDTAALLSPPGQITPYPVDVEACFIPFTGEGSICSSPTPADQFTYTAVPVVIGLSPPQDVIAGGQFITIFGENFGTDPSRLAVFFGATAAIDVALVSPTEIICIDPAHNAGTIDVSVSVNGAASTKTPADLFTYIYPGVGGPNPPAFACAQSLLYDRQQLLPPPVVGTAATAPNQILSLCDRVPAGKYAIVRDIPAPLSQLAAQGRTWGLRGIVFNIADDTTLADTRLTMGYGERVPQIEYAPSQGPQAQPWQVWQALLAADAYTGPSTAYQLPGSQTLHNTPPALACGGLFTLRQTSFRAPAAAGYAIGRIASILALDFIMVDIDDLIWASPNAGAKLLQLLQMVHQAATRPPNMPSGLQTISQYRPVFVIFPSTPSAYPSLFAPDQPVIEGLVNGDAGPKTIASARLTPNGNLTQAWGWTRPLDNQGTGMNHLEPVIDLRGGGDPTGLVSAAVAPNSLPVSFAGLSNTWRVNSGAIFYDDWDALSHAGGPAGPRPVQYWDYGASQGPVSVPGAIVPSFFPDPMPIAETNHDWAVLDPQGNRVRFTVGMENWRTGHTTANNYPTWATVTDPQCPGGTTQPTIHNWITINGVPMAPAPGASAYSGSIRGHRLEFGGVPVSGDDGVYPFLITVQRGQTSNDLATSFHFVLDVVDPTRVEQVGNLVSSTGIPIGAPDIAAQTDWGGGLHAATPKMVSTYRIPQDWGTAANWCAGTGVNAPAIPLPPKVVGTPYRQISACGYPYLPDTIYSALAGCRGTVQGFSPPAYCADPVMATAYASFVFAVASALSGNDSNYQQPPLFGLFALSNLVGPGRGYTFKVPTDPQHDLSSPSVQIALAAPYLQQAWAQTQQTDCAGRPLEQMYAHAYMLFTGGVGNYGGVASDITCSQVPLGVPPPNLATMAGTGNCFRTTYSTNYSGQSSPPGTGQSGSYPDICSLAQAAYAGGFRPGKGSFGSLGLDEFTTVVAIAVSEAGGAGSIGPFDPYMTSQNPAVSCVTHLPTQYSAGVLQFTPDCWTDYLTETGSGFGLQSPMDCAHDPICAFTTLYKGLQCQCPPGTPPNVSCCSPALLSLAYSPDYRPIAVPGTGPGSCAADPGQCYCCRNNIQNVIAALEGCNLTGQPAYAPPVPQIPTPPQPNLPPASPAAVLGCPVGSTNSDNPCPPTICGMSADCQYHADNEGLLAVDLAGPTGTPILATCPGTIVQRRFDPSDGYGNRVVIHCDFNPNIVPDPSVPFYTRMAHMDAGSLDCVPDSIYGYPCEQMHVQSGQIIGRMDSTGHVIPAGPDGSHTHYEIMIGGLGPQYTVCPIAQGVYLLGKYIPAGPDYLGQSCFSDTPTGHPLATGGPEAVTALDLSNFSGVPTPADFNYWRSQGVQRAIIRLSMEANTASCPGQSCIETAFAQIVACHQANFTVDGYIWSYSTDDPTQVVQQTIVTYDALGISFYWLDIEDLSPPNAGGGWGGVPPSQAINWIATALNALGDAGKPAGIYTNLGGWGPITGNTTLFATVPLWWASANNLSNNSAKPDFGGWQRSYGNQYQENSTAWLQSQQPVDVNAFDPYVFTVFMTM